MKITVYGLGCDKYFNLLNMVKKAVKQLNLKADVNEIYNRDHLVRDGIVYMPSMMINDKIVLKGTVPSMDELKALLVQNNG